MAARENDCLAPIDAECAKVPACVHDTKKVHDVCRRLRQQEAAICRTYVCERIQAMPRPPMSDSRD
ncbi:MAG: hypothetical protein JNL21_21955 [Myxococcales bacterium]|nr:hypothetical protein [Myxococcales bacterium]